MLTGRRVRLLKGKPSGSLLKGHDLIAGKEESAKKKRERNVAKF